MIDRYPSPQRRRPSSGCARARISRLLGLDVPAADVARILEALGLRRRGRC